MRAALFTVLFYLWTTLAGIFVLPLLLGLLLGPHGGTHKYYVLTNDVVQQQRTGLHLYPVKHEELGRAALADFRQHFLHRLRRRVPADANQPPPLSAW